jgi:hypothetical protein
MLLSDVDDPIGGWEYAERYLNVGTRTYSPFARDLDISDPYHPQLGSRSFHVQTWWVPHEEGSYLRSSVESELHAIYHDCERFLLPVHPETMKDPELHRRDDLLRCRPGPPIEVVPSANARTVFVKRIDGLPVKPHFLKLHYPKRLSRFPRRLPRPTIALHLWVADELSRIGTPFLPELGGGVFGRDPRESWGFVMREACPRGTQVSHTVPLFALYGRDWHAAEDPTLLEQLVLASGDSPEGYLIRQIVRPMVRLWLDVVHRTGCALELHGQNTLFTFSTATGEGRIVYRDCAVYVDPAIRSQLDLGVHLPETNVISRDVLFTREQVFSLTYDSFMGHHALSYVAREAHHRWGVRPEVLHAAAKDQFAERCEDVALLPDTVFYYDGSLHPDEGWKLVDTGSAPLWR